MCTLPGSECHLDCVLLAKILLEKFAPRRDVSILMKQKPQLVKSAW